MKQQVIYKVSGMQKDVSDSSMDKQHAFDIHNMRLRNSDTNIVSALINEMGNIKARGADNKPVSIRGTVIGYNTLNDTGIIFTHEELGKSYHDVTEGIVNTPALISINPNTHLPDEPDEPDEFVDRLVSYKYAIDTPINGSSTEYSDNLKWIDVTARGNSVISFNIQLSKFHNTDLYAGQNINNLATVINITTGRNSDNMSAEFIHDFESTDSLGVSKSDVVGGSYWFTVRLTAPEALVTKEEYTVDVIIATVSNSTGLSPVILKLHVTVPGDGTRPKPDDDEQEQNASYEVVCDYPEETSRNTCDHIYLITVNKRDVIKDDGDDTEVTVFEYFRGDLNFSAEYPIESTVYFENEKIQKIYWVDGLNPLRYANIADKNGDTYWSSNIKFDSVPLLHLQEHVSINRNSTGGMFPSGTLQWCFTYLDRYGAESNIAWISPIHYSSPDDRGGAPGETCSNSFTIEINGYEPDGRFSYIRLYHILHTSLDSEVSVRRVADIAVPVKNQNNEYPAIIYTDTNTTGESVDPNELLYLGGISVIPNTIEQKSNTLFLGNLKQQFKYLRDIIDDLNETLSTDSKIPWGTSDSITFESVKTGVPADVRSGFYSHQNQLLSNSWNITSFRRGEKYRFGFQAQDKTGRWSDVWWLGDCTNTDKFPKFADYRLFTVQAQCTVPESLIAELRDNGYRKIRPVVVYPKPWERNIFTEGLLNPTVYNVKDRASNAPFAQSSWFIRPFAPIDLGTINASGNDGFGNISSSYVINGTTYDSLVPFPESNTFVGYADDATGSWNILSIDDVHWFDPLTPGDTGIFTDITNLGSWAEYRHNHPLGDSQQRNCEIQSMYNPRNGYTESGTDANLTLMSVPYKLTFPYTDNSETAKREFVNQFSDFFYVDQSILTMNSADIQFDEALSSQDLDGYSLRITGIVPITSFISSFDILTKTPPNKFYEGDNNGLSIPQGLYGSEVIGARFEDIGFGWKSMISGAIWHDDFCYNSVKDSSYDNSDHIPIGFAVYPWQGQGSLNNDSVGTRRDYSDDTSESKSNVGDNYISAELKEKVLANMHYSWRTYNILDLSYANRIRVDASVVLDTQQVSLTKLDEVFSSGTGTMHYFGSVDKLITPVIGKFASDGDYTQYPMSRIGGYPKMASYLPAYVHNVTNILDVYTGIDNTDQSHMVFSSPYTPLKVFNTLTGFTQRVSIYDAYNRFNLKSGSDKSMASIPIKYKSCNHIVLAIDPESGTRQKCISWGGGVYNHNTGDGSLAFSSTNEPFWKTDFTGISGLQLFNDGFHFDNCHISTADNYSSMLFGDLVDKQNGQSVYKPCGYLFLGQFFRDEAPNRFGGNSDEALEQNTWLPAGDAVYLSDIESRTYENDEVVPLKLVWKAGDTYYQRYDALRTYPFTEEDQNKVIDIVSFMTETYTNIDGRYDKNRGLSNNNHVRPQNFNKLNPVYSQRDNFFSYHTLNPKKVHLSVFEYSFTWSLSKTAGALRDEWTRVTLASTYDCDGNKGKLNRITRLDNQLVAFQDGGVSQVLFNENVQLQGSEGTPIELANSGKMQGLRYYTTEVGCQNKWSIAVQPNGIYWIDGRSKEFYMIGGSGIVQISTPKLMSTWFKNRQDLFETWNPSKWKGFFTHRDITTGELFITSSDTSLCYDTLTGEFTSFYDYQKTDAMFALNGCVITAAQSRGGSIVGTNVVLNDNLWLHRKNRQRHCMFYNKQYPASIEIVCNSNNEGNDYGTDKVFDNMSWRADAWKSNGNAWDYMPFITFTNMEGSDNYQRFSAQFNAVNGNASNNSVPQLSNPHKPINLRKKFKVWYTTMPRAQHLVDGEWVQTRDRIRDTWCHIKLELGTNSSLYRNILHDIVVTYFIQ